jgi:acetolactate synthase-1/2/3 large subunit
MNDEIQEAINQINNSQKPFFVIGNGVVREDAVNGVQAFIDRLQAPVTHSFKAKGILSKDHPQNYFTFGFKEQDEVLSGLEEADLLIVVGFDFVEQLPKGWNKKKVPVIHIHTVPAESDEYYPVQAELAGSFKEIFQAINGLKVLPKPWEPSGNLREKIRQAYFLNDVETSELSITSILHTIEKHSCERTIVVSDVGSHKVSIARTFQPKGPNNLIMSNGLATMGIAIPGSIGAKLAHPESPVICLTGDGGALMNFAEIETAARLGLSFVIIVLNDSKLKLEEQMMMKQFGNTHGTAFRNPDFVQLAKSFGIKGVRPAGLQEFESMLEEALKLRELTLIEIQSGEGNF